MLTCYNFTKNSIRKMMNITLKKFLTNVNNLSSLDPKNLPENIVKEICKLDEQELFKTCSQLYILQNNIPNENKILNLSEDDIVKGSIEYAQNLLKRAKTLV